MNSLTSWFAMVFRAATELPSEPPCGLAETVPNWLVTVQLTGAGTPCVAEATVWLAGSTVTPWAAAFRVNGLTRRGEVRRASTCSSQIPGSGVA